MRSRRLFVALWPDSRQRDQLRDVISPLARQLEGDRVLRGNWHVTLAFLGAYPEARIPALLTAAQSVTVEPFRLRFDRAEYWPRPKLGVLLARAVPPELERLVTALTGIVTAAGVAPDERLFRPHVTFLRRARPFEPQRLARPHDTEWSGFELLESLAEPGGSNYRPLTL
jgi:2'-5' RNA ligase